MSDAIFFPIAIVFVAGLAVAALLPGVGQPHCDSVGGAISGYDAVPVRGQDLCRLRSGLADNVVLLGGKDPSAVRITTRGPLTAKPTLASHFRLGRDLEVQFSGFTVTTEITARTATGKPGAVELNYSAGADGSSGWRRFEIPPGGTVLRLAYDVPVSSSEQGVDYFAIQPVITGPEGAIEVESVVFRRGPRWTPPPQ